MRGDDRLSTDRKYLLQKGILKIIMSEKHIFISYCHSDKEVVHKIKDKLKEKGLKVWIDVDDMTGHLLDSMSSAVQNAKLAIICMSEKYKVSDNCKIEATYTRDEGVPIIPLMMQKGFRPKDWLGILVSGLLYINFDGKVQFEVAINMLLTEIEKKIGKQGIEKKIETQGIEKKMGKQGQTKDSGEGNELDALLNRFFEEKVTSLLANLRLELQMLILYLYRKDVIDEVEYKIFSVLAYESKARHLLATLKSKSGNRWPSVLLDSLRDESPDAAERLLQTIEHYRISIDLKI